MLAIFAFSCSGLFAQQSSKLLLTSGDTIECSTIKQVFTSQLLCYLCNSDTIKTENIRGMTDTAGYHPYLQNAFLSIMTDGKVSIYSGNIPSLEISNATGIKSGLSVEPVFHKKVFYTFDDFTFYEFKSFGSNNPLERELKLCPDASEYYTGYRLFSVASIAFLGTSIIPLIGGLFALSDHSTENGVTLLITSGVGITVSTVMYGVIGKRFFNRSIEIFNKK
jgi:hypothetical protein